MSNKSNKSNANPGFEAIKAWKGAHELQGKGDAIALRAFLAFDWDKPLTAVIESKKGTVKDTFTLRDYAVNPLHADGVTVDTKCKSARLLAILEAVFSATGDDVTRAIKQNVARCYGAALAIKTGLAGKASVNANNEIKLPVSMLVNFRNEKGELTPNGRKAVTSAITSAAMNGEEIDEAEALERLSNLTVPCTGEEHPFFGDVPSQTDAINMLKKTAIDAGVLLSFKPRASRTNDDDEGIAFSEAVNFAAEVMTSVVETDESPVAFTPELRAKLFRLSELLAAYFAADPLANDELKSA
jgi:hypothetical protein